MPRRLKRVAPRVITQPPASTSTGGRLPDEILSEGVRRVAVFSLTGAILWTYGILMDTLIVPSTVGPVVNGHRAAAIEIACVLLSGAVLAYLRRADHQPATKIMVGHAFLVSNAFAIALFDTWVQPPTTDGMPLSWNTILILFYSMIAPAAPRQMLIASLVAASMDPLGVWLAHLRGVPVPSPISTFVLYLPNYVCAVLTMVPSRVFQHLGSRIREAQRLGSYELVDLLGEGGMGEVWRGRHHLLARHAAIKLVRPDVLGAGTDAETRVTLERFEREARATATLSSPHTIQVFDYGTTDEGTFYYVMEMLAGRDLESLVREFGPLPANRTLFLLRQICHSLADAHARGLVHRDVKPANLYVCRLGLDYDFMKVLDFGLVTGEASTLVTRTLLTTDHRTSGTPAYMAPEIILGESAVDQRADIYALGCVVYFLLTGQLVFEAETPMKMLLQHVQAVPVPPSQRTELRVPPELDALVLRCLDKDPRRRPQDARELLDIVSSCRTCETWTPDLAASWWTTHLPDLTRPLGQFAASPTCTAA
jgi:serine/threonine-protein kinase